jgi:hypothetical protein
MTSDAIDPREPGTEIEARGHPLRSTREPEIRCGAFEIYLARGAQPGRELEDWLQAEREFTAEWRRTERIDSEPRVASYLIDKNNRQGATQHGDHLSDRRQHTSGPVFPKSRLNGFFSSCISEMGLA